MMKIQSSQVAGLFFIGMSCLAIPAAQAQQSSTVRRIYISPKGSDQNTGTSAKPFATADAALRAAEKYKKGKADSGIEIIFNGGTYYLDKPIQLLANHSGSKRQPLRIKAADGKQVILSGGRTLDLKWEQGDKGIWKAKVPAGVSFQSLYANEKHLVRARYPNYDASILPFQGYASDALSPARIATWKNPTGGIVHALHAGRWGGFHYRITGKEDSSKVMLEGGEQNNRPSKMHETYRFVENIFEELDTAQEWYLDEATATLYYMPSHGKDPNQLKFVAPQLESLITISGSASGPVHDIEISGLCFTHTAPTFMKTSEPLLRSDWTIYRQGAVKIEGAENCTLRANDFVELGGNAVFVSNYNRGVKISGNRIEQIGAGGINFVGDPEAVRSPAFRYEKFVPLSQIDTLRGPKTNNYPMDCEASDNMIHTIGLIEKQVAGVQVSMAESLRILHNTIYNVPRAGINVGDGTWGGHEIAYNDVFNTVLETSDHGAFNSWGRDRFWHPDRKEMDQMTAAHPNLILLDAVRTTKIHDNRFRCDHGWDIDLDDGSSNYEIYNNLCLSGGLKLREGFYRKVYNNVMINNGFHPHVWFKDSHDIFRDNLVMHSHQDIQVKYWGDEVDHNIYTRKEDLLKDQTKGVEKHGRVVPLNFVDAIQGDFRLKDWKGNGFKNFDMLHFGVKDKRLKSLAASPEIPQLIRSGAKEQGLKWGWKGGQFKSVETLGEQSAAGLQSIAGVLVLQLDEKSTLYKSGLRANDVILDYQGEKIEKLTDLQQAIKKLIHADQPKVVVVRNQQQQKLALQL
ncbi:MULTISPECIES: PDZ domain-containing protein [Sphingobacterium]|uniref:PDZ domain-containing protein n=1 Tax=Sphingobacterium TaxID=28453 RepID=UPI00257ED5B1|nr:MULTISPECIES: PDZ domain-containing protein [Sphingobacterium]